MHLTYDREADAVSIDLKPRAKRKTTRKVSPGVFVHTDRRGTVIEIEILAASSRYSSKELKALDSPAEWLTLIEAANEAGLSPSTLRNQIKNGKLIADKKGHDWRVTRAALWSYLENRSPAGRRAAVG